VASGPARIANIVAMFLKYILSFWIFVCLLTLWVIVNFLFQIVFLFVSMGEINYEA